MLWKEPYSLKEVSYQEMQEKKVNGDAVNIDNFSAEDDIPQLQRLQRKVARKNLSLPRRNSTDDLPLSYAQERIWFLEQSAVGNAFNANRCLAVHLSGSLDITALERSFIEILSRHEILRATFIVNDDRPVQHISPNISFNLVQEDLLTLSEAEKDTEIKRQIANEIRLAREPLLRAKLFRLAENENVLITTVNHLVADYWSMFIFTQELTLFYNSFHLELLPPLSPLPIQYADYIMWQKHYIQGNVAEILNNYWETQLASPVTNILIPLYHSHASLKASRNETYVKILPQDLVQKLKEFSQQEDVSLLMSLLTAYQALLARICIQTDILVGMPVAGRQRAELEGPIGLFTNMLGLRTDLSGNPTFRILLQRVRKVVLDAYEHQDLPFAKLINDIQLKQKLDHMSLFQIAFALQDDPTPALNLAGLSVRFLELEGQGLNFDTGCDIGILLFEMQDGALQCTWEYATELFDAVTIHRMADQFQLLIEGLIVRPEQHLHQISLLSATELQHLLTLQRNMIHEPIPMCSVQQLFERQVRQTPDAIALVFVEQQISYQELEERANQLAMRLWQLNVRPEECVGLWVQRSPDLLIGILGILKAGCAYVPLDPSYPTERLAFMLQDAQIRLLVTQETERQVYAELWTDWQVQFVCLEHRTEVVCQEFRGYNLEKQQVDPLQLAYVIYTSGSTGTPKGVQVSHIGVVNFLCTMQRRLAVQPTERVLALTTLAFDIAVLELLLPLTMGGQVLLQQHALARDGVKLSAQLEREAPTMMQATPTTWRLLVGANWQGQAGMRVLSGGEALDLELSQQLLKRGKEVWNLYGPTETTIWSLMHQLTGQEERVPLGQVLDNTQCYVVDGWLHPVPVGVIGEVYIGGVGLARGYLHRPDLTAERFIPDPFSQEPGARLYHTGDLARYHADGALEFLGRVDQQVKLRGYRIELGEIEAVLKSHPHLQDAVVLLSEDASHPAQLVAYIVGRQGHDGSIEQLRRFLVERLPDYMVPALFMPLERLPLTPNGKVDRRLLPSPQYQRETTHSFVAPRTPVEETLATIWSRVLGVEPVGIYDDFFALGGDSIRSIQILSLAREWGVIFPLSQMFQAPTIAALAQHLREEKESEQEELASQPFALLSPQERARLPEDVEDAYPLTRLQAGMLFHSIYNRETSAYHDVFSYHLHTLLNQEALAQALQRVIERHPLLRTSFDLHTFEEPLQLVHRQVQPCLEIQEELIQEGEEQERWLQVSLQRERHRVLDWEQAPLFRVLVQPYRDETFQLTLSFHHAILDGWSVASLLTEMFQEYWRVMRDEPIRKGVPIPSFREYVAQEQQVLARADAQEYWRQQVKDAPSTRLPQRETPASSEQVGIAFYEVPIPASLTAPLKRLAQGMAVPLKSVLLTAHLKVLGMLSGQDDVLTGVIVNGRLEVAGGEQVLGLFLNTVPYRLVVGEYRWDELIHATFAREQEQYPYRRYPLAQIQHVAGREVLFETAFNYVHFHVYERLAQEGEVQVMGAQVYEETNFALVTNFSLDPESQQLQVRLDYERSRLSVEQVKRIGAYYVSVCEQMVKAPQQKHTACCLLPVEEQEEQVEQWNETRCEYEVAGSISQLFEQQVRQTPDGVALVFGEQQISYGQLEEKANQVAHSLQRLGVGPEVCVGVCLERSPELVIGLLAVLKAGGAYVPLDPTYPQERLAFIIEDSKIPILLSQTYLINILPHCDAKILYLDVIAQEPSTRPISVTSSNNLMYVLYTSGSTGRPKGVMGLHGATINRLAWMWHAYPLKSGEVCCQKTSLNFVDAVWEVWGPLLQGRPLVLIPDSIVHDPHRLIETLVQQYISRIVLVPSLLQAILEISNYLERQLPLLKLWIVSGETLTVGLVDQIFTRLPHCTLLNLYGSSEAAADATFYEVHPYDSVSNIPIGRPIANIQTYILDDHLQLQPVCVPGELYIGGAGLSRGYLNRPDLTAEKFIPHPFAQIAGERLYRTGDFARYRSDGTLEFLGRVDQQVKLRGYRIEPGEIEGALQRHEAVQKCIVEMREDHGGNKRLVAYMVVHEGKEISTTQMRLFLSTQLPSYMVPSAVVVLDEFPLTPNGKLDRRALPDPREQQQRSHDYVAPRTELETQLAAVLAEVLHIDRVGIYDDFFELGGDSIVSIQVVTRTYRMGLSLTPQQLFQYHTIADLVDNLDSMSSNVDRIQPVETKETLSADFSLVKLNEQTLNKLLMTIEEKDKS